MNTKLLICIVVVVAVAHLALLRIIDQVRKFGAPKPPRPPEPSFTTTTFRYRDQKGQDVKVVQEFKISTKFADQETLDKLPPPPSSVAAQP